MAQQNENKRPSVPLQARLIVLLASSLLGSLAVILWSGANIVLEDKSTYILDYCYSHVRSAAIALESQFQSATQYHRLLRVYHGVGDEDGGQQVFKDGALSLGVRRSLVMDRAGDGPLSLARSYGDSDKSLAQLLDFLGWDAHAFEEHRLLVGRAPNGQVAIGQWIPDPDQGKKSLAFLTLLKPQPKTAESIENLKLYVVDSAGRPLFEQGRGDDLPARDLGALLLELARDNVDSGARRWELSGRDPQLVAYQKIGFGGLVAVGLIPEKIAFSAIGELVLRSILLGIAVFLISTGAGLLTVRRLTSGLSLIAKVAEMIGEGRYDVRIDSASLGSDEIGFLARTLNSMAVKLSKAKEEFGKRQEFDAKQTQVIEVQKNFVPAEGLEHSQVKLSGKVLSSDRFRGDWWYRERVGENVIWLVGKADAEGFDAAIAVAAARGAAATFVSGLKRNKTEAPSVKVLASHLDAAVTGLEGGAKKPMPCLMAVMDTQSGKAQVINAGYPIPLIHRTGFGGRPKEVSDRYLPLTKKKQPALGAGEGDYEVEPIQLQAADSIFIYSAAVLDAVPLPLVYKHLALAIDQFEANPERVLEEMVAAIEKENEKTFSGGASLVVAHVPKKAVFMTREEKKPKPPKNVLKAA